MLVLNLQEAEQCCEHTANISFTFQIGWDYHATLNDGIKLGKLLSYVLIFTWQLSHSSENHREKKKKVTTLYQRIIADF